MIGISDFDSFYHLVFRGTNRYILSIFDIINKSSSRHYENAESNEQARGGEQ